MSRYHSKQYINPVFFLVGVLVVLFLIMYFFKDTIQEQFQLDENMKIPIYDFTHVENQGGYNLGDLLNMPSLLISEWGRNPHNDYNTYLRAIQQFPDSIVAFYAKLRQDPQEPIPDPFKVEQAVEMYVSKNPDLVNRIQQEGASDDQVLYIHLRSGDKGVVEDSFIQAINQVASQYRKLVVLTGIHSDERTQKLEKSKENLMTSLRKINNDQMDLNLDTADNHLATMHKCQNLMVHKGGFSVLGAWVFTGKQLYYTELFEPSPNSDFWKYIHSTKSSHYTKITLN